WRAGCRRETLASAVRGSVEEPGMQSGPGIAAETASLATTAQDAVTPATASTAATTAFLLITPPTGSPWMLPMPTVRARQPSSVSHLIAAAIIVRRRFPLPLDGSQRQTEDPARRRVKRRGPLGRGPHLHVLLGVLGGQAAVRSAERAIGRFI